MFVVVVVTVQEAESTGLYLATELNTRIHCQRTQIYIYYCYIIVHNFLAESTN